MESDVDSILLKSDVDSILLKSDVDSMLLESAVDSILLKNDLDSLFLKSDVALTSIISRTSPLEAFILRVKSGIRWQSYSTRFVLSVILYQTVRHHT